MTSSLCYRLLFGSSAGLVCRVCGLVFHRVCRIVFRGTFFRFGLSRFYQVYVVLCVVCEVCSECTSSLVG